MLPEVKSITDLYRIIYICCQRYLLSKIFKYIIQIIYEYLKFFKISYLEIFDWYLEWHYKCILFFFYMDVN